MAGEKGKESGCGAGLGEAEQQTTQALRPRAGGLLFRVKCCPALSDGHIFNFLSVLWTCW